MDKTILSIEMSEKNHRAKVLKIVFCIFIVLLFQDALAQNQISFRQLSVKEGLSQNSAIAITQDSTGYLWIATQDGLNKYDGKKFKVFLYNFVDITTARLLKPRQGVCR